MLATCNKCGAILEYDPETGCMECPNDIYERAWVEAEYTIADISKNSKYYKGSDYYSH